MSMNRLNPDDFEKILDSIENNIEDIVECGAISSIESNFNTKGLQFKAHDDSQMDGTIIVGEDKGCIAVDIGLSDGSARSFVLRDQNDSNGVANVIGWFEHNYKKV